MALKGIVSPWDDIVDLPSPDGQLCAGFRGNEICMGGPSRGTLQVSNGYIYVDHANGSMLWSSDSKYLAFPVWRLTREQELVVVDVHKRSVVKRVPGFRVIELHTFQGRIVIGIDSPAYQPKDLSFDFNDLP